MFSCYGVYCEVIRTSTYQKVNNILCFMQKKCFTEIYYTWRVLKTMYSRLRANRRCGQTCHSIFEVSQARKKQALCLPPAFMVVSYLASSSTWRWRQNVPQICWLPVQKLHSAILKDRTLHNHCWGKKFMFHCTLFDSYCILKVRSTQPPVTHWPKSLPDNDTPSWCIRYSFWTWLLYVYVSFEYGLRVKSASKRNEYQKSSWG
jgi:hypothetical protein